MFTEPKRASQAILSSEHPRSYDGDWADASVDLPANCILARRTVGGLIVQWDPTEDDGTEDALGVYADGAIIGVAGAKKRVSWAFQEAEIDFKELVLPEDVDFADVVAALPKLTIRG
jgi:hypothetical protein